MINGKCCSVYLIVDWAFGSSSVPAPGNWPSRQKYANSWGLATYEPGGGALAHLELIDALFSSSITETLSACGRLWIIIQVTLELKQLRSLTVRTENLSILTQPNHRPTAV